MKEIRTPKGKLVGTLDERTSVLIIRDGKKQTRIPIPPGGLRLTHSSGNGAYEDVYIVPPDRVTAA